MQLSYFRTLATPWQAHLICECGVLLADRTKRDTWIELYQIDSFYVEVHYQQPDNEIIAITCFQDTDYLEPYFDTTTLQEIVLNSVKKE